MTDSPRWERESQEDLRSSAPQSEQTGSPASRPDETVEFDMEAAGQVDPAALSDPPEYGARADLDDVQWPDREPRMTTARESLTATRDSIATTAGRVGRWFASLDRRPEYEEHVGEDIAAQLSPPARAEAAEIARGPEPEATDASSRFPTAPLGYNRQAVDHHIAELEAELERLRAAARPTPPSITEEIERLGEQTASILVVAHDKAHETARRAQEQAARAVTEASENAERITGEAERRLRELDEETDVVWRERERLIDDVRIVSQALTTLADEASERFPAAEPREPVLVSGAPERAEDADSEPPETPEAPGDGPPAPTFRVRGVPED